MPRPDRRFANHLAGLCCLGLLVLAAGPASAQYRDPVTAPPAQNTSGPRTTPYHYSSDEGNFQVTWPSGCGQLRIRANEPEYFEGEESADVVLVYHVSCDQFDVQGEGCSVTATFDARDAAGEPAGPEQVIARVRNALKTYGVAVVRQAPVRKEFANGLVVEGVDVFGTGAGGKGEFRVRGVLAGHEIYVLTAWSAKGDLWDNAEFLEFFNDFMPYAE